MSLMTAAMIAVALGGNPCADAGARCPDLVMRTPSQFHLLRGKYLASTNQIVNAGKGPAEIRARRPGKRHEMFARQVLRGGPGFTPVVLPSTGIRVRFYDTGTRGKYWKFADIARFELWTLHADGTLASRRRDGPKLYYCLRDLRRLKKPNGRTSYADSPKRMHYPACSEDPDEQRRTLGTSVGWTDAYPWSYPENWISVRGLKGCFAYVQRVDPLDQMLELDESNNASAVTVRLPWKGPGRRGCPSVKGSLAVGA